MKSVRLNSFAILIALTLISVAVAPTYSVAAETKLNKNELKGLLETAKSPADHQRLAAYYRQEVQRLVTSSNEHWKQARAYENNQPFAALEVKHGFAFGQGASHCRYFAKLDELEAIARTLAKTLNCERPVKKAGVAAGIGLLAGVIGWRAAGATYGLVGVAAALVIVPMLARLGAGGSVVRAAHEPPLPSGWGIRDSRGFSALCAIGMIDNATRTGFLTFMPFILIAKDLGVGGVGLAFSLVFIGGATGKFVCGFFADRVGVIRTVVLTEAATTVLILVVVAAPLSLALTALLPLGVALNGTSSVLYGTVADLVSSERRSRAYGLYYTATIAASALAPTIWGFVGDITGVPTTLSMVAIVVLATIPLCLVLRPAVTAPASA